MKTYTIYKLNWTTRPEVYVGRTSRTVKERLRAHLHSADLSSTIPVRAAIAKYGRPETAVLETTLDEEWSFKREQYWIKRLKTLLHQGGLNVQCGGRSTKQPKHKLMKQAKQEIRGVSTGTRKEKNDRLQLALLRRVQNFQANC